MTSQNKRHIPKKRNRPTIVCSNCRRRKSKCNRERPCSRCIQLHNEDTCEYPNSVKDEEEQVSVEPKHTDDILQPDKITPNPPTLSELEPTSQLKLVTIPSKRSLTPSDTDVFPVNKKRIQKVYHVSTPELINIIPNGFYLEVKRSAINMFAQFVDLSMEHRDIYLEMMTRFRSMAIKKMSRKYEQDTKNQKHKFNPNLPNSFKPLSVFDFHEQKGQSKLPANSHIQYEQHKILFDRFAKMRKNESIKFLKDENIDLKEILVDQNLFLNEILPFFNERISPLIPIFNMEVLTNEFTDFYKSVPKKKLLSIKKFDHIILCIIMLMTLLSKLSISSSKYSHIEAIHGSILNIDTTKYLAVIHHYLFQMKVLRKCTLLQLQCLVLLKFYQWCSPEDGDGSDGQHNQILLGTIIASAKELGINWNCVNNESYIFKVSNGARPSLVNLPENQYLPIYKNIWSMIICWDRKMSLAFGQECLVSKSFTYPLTHENGEDNYTWHTNMLSIDNILLRINDLIHDTPTRVNISMIEDMITQIKNEIKLVRSIASKHYSKAYKNGNSSGYNSMDEISSKALDIEFDWCLNLLELFLLHARMVYYERTMDYIRFHGSMQELWNYLIIISKKCYDYFFPPDNQEHLNGFMRFYCNRIVEIVANKICVLLPTFILRLQRFPQLKDEDRELMCKFLYRISSIYFNEFAFEHYKSFKKMFTAKISYKMLNRPSGKDIWKNILQFLVYKMNVQEEILKSENKPDIICTLLRDLLPYLGEYYQYVKQQGFDFTDGDGLVKVWNQTMIPISQYDEFFKLNLHEERLSFIQNDKYSHQLNIFASFYDNSGNELAAGTYGDELLARKQKLNGGKKPGKGTPSTSQLPSLGEVAASQAGNNNAQTHPVMFELGDKPSPINNLNQLQLEYPGSSSISNISSNQTNNDLDLDDLTRPIESFTNLEFLNDLFEPTDFISFFD